MTTVRIAGASKPSSPLLSIAQFLIIWTVILNVLLSHVMPLNHLAARASPAPRGALVPKWVDDTRGIYGQKVYILSSFTRGYLKLTEQNTRYY